MNPENQPQPPQFFQPGAQPPPNPGFPQQSPPNPLQAFPPQKKRLPKFPKRLVALLATILFIGLAVGAAWYFFFKPVNPEVLFSQALENALSTQSFQMEQSTSTDGYETASVVRVDSTDIKNPKISSTYTDKYDQQETTIDSWATISKSYMKVGANDPAYLAELQDISGKWIETTGPDGSDSQTYFPLYLSVASPESAMLGYFVHGNFNSTDKTNLKNFLIDNDVYSYGVEEVYERKIGKKDVLVFEADVNENKLRDFNKQAAKAIGIDEKQLDPVIGYISAGLKIKFYISLSEQRILKIDIEQSSTTTEINYSGFNSTKIEDEPDAEVSYDEYEKLFGDYLIDYDEVYDEGDESYDDIERKTDINAIFGQLEAYNAQNGRYPTLNDMNDSTFVAENMPGLTNDNLHDPATIISGLSPIYAQGMYQYEVLPEGCDNAEDGDCLQYALRATLDDGSFYEKLSLN